jgi:hypothetical protein
MITQCYIIIGGCQMMTRTQPWPGQRDHHVRRLLFDGVRPKVEGQCPWKDGAPTGYYSNYYFFDIANRRGSEGKKV